MFVFLQLGWPLATVFPLHCFRAKSFLPQHFSIPLNLTHASYQSGLPRLARSSKFTIEGLTLGALRRAPKS